MHRSPAASLVMLSLLECAWHATSSLIPPPPLARSLPPPLKGETHETHPDRIHRRDLRHRNRPPGTRSSRLFFILKQRKQQAGVSFGGTRTDEQFDGVEQDRIE